jgi:hypothetical protein
VRVGVGVGRLGSCGRRAIVSIAILSIAIVSIAIGRVWVRVPGGYIYIYTSFLPLSDCPLSASIRSPSRNLPSTSAAPPGTSLLTYVVGRR